MAIVSSQPTMAKGHRIGRRRTYRPLAEINVTPMVDVMLVLLVIFMITAPLLTVGVEVDLPETQSSVLRGNDEPLSVTIDAAGQLFIQENPVTLEELAPRLLAISGANPDLRIFVRGDQGIAYGHVMTVMSTITEAGYRRVALITQPLKSGRPQSASSSTRP